MSTWQEDRVSDFAAMAVEWPVAITRNGITAACIKTPDLTDRDMLGGGYQENARATFDMLWEDSALYPALKSFGSLSLGNRVQFKCGDVNYEVQQYRRDSSDPIVQFSAAKLK